MRWMRLTLLPALLLGCNDAGFDAVSIRPTYGWTDGCTDVKIGGHGFDDQVTAKIDGNDVTGITLPDPQEFPLDVGFTFNAVTPAGAVGFRDLVVTNGDGQSATVNKAFYYVQCPGAPNVDSMAPLDISSGSTVTLSGCGFATVIPVAITAAEDLTNVLASAPIDLTCLTAVGSFTAPALPDGEYEVLILDSGGNVVAGGAPCHDTDTADTGFFQPGLCLTYGAAPTTPTSSGTTGGSN